MVLEPAVKFSVTSGLPMLLALAANAQHLPPSPQTDERPSFRVPSNLVFLPTRVQNKSGDGIYGLAQEQFVVEDDGVRQTVRIEDSPDSEGLSLVLTVQCGRSAAAEFDKLKGLGTMVEEMVGSAPSEVAVASTVRERISSTISPRALKEPAVPYRASSRAEITTPLRSTLCIIR